MMQRVVGLIAAVVCAASPVLAAELQTRCKPVVTRETVVETHRRLAAAGRAVRPLGLVGATGFDFSDTPLGVLRRQDGSYAFFGSDGSCHRDCFRPTERDGSITRTIGTLDDPIGQAAPVETVLPGSTAQLPAYVNYAGGGPVIRLGSTVLLVYHAERATYLPGHTYPDCDPTGRCGDHQNGIYSWLGLAASADDGATWRDMGLVVGANTPYSPHIELDIGDGGLVVQRGPVGEEGRFAYIYFPDRVTSPAHPEGEPTRMSVARVPLGALRRAAARGEPAPPFVKYYAGAWTEPGMGGKSSDLLVGVSGLETAPGNHFDPEVVWNRAVHRYAAILSDNTVQYTESADGLHWSQGVELRPHIDQNNQVALYASPAGLERNAEALGANFAIYYVFQKYYGAGAGWPSAELRRMDITCSAVD